MNPTRFDAYSLFHRGALCLARAEMVGLCVDIPYLTTHTKKLKDQLDTAKANLLKSELGKQWEKLYPGKVKIRSPQQIQKVLFGHFKIPVVLETEKGNPQVNEEALMSCRKQVKGIDDLLRYRALDKTLFTYFAQIQRETHDGRMHPFFHLHTVQTYRGSSSDPNFQNMPNRDVEFAEVVRRAILPPPGFHLVEFDYKGLEVCFAAVVTRDPNLIAYVTDTTQDMHRDTGMELFLLPKEELEKKIRHVSKNGFVFPEFYGSYWEQCAKNIWADIEGLKTTSGKDLRSHLLEQGLHNRRPTQSKNRNRPDPSPWEKHVQSVERLFWEKRFPVYAQWRKDQFESYLDKGYLETKTGFQCAGLMRKNQVANYPIQGPAFNGLLWSLCNVDKYIYDPTKKRRARICGQIHDSMIMIIPPDELEETIRVVRDISCNKLRKEWPWIDVPLTLETDVAPLNKSWFEKAPWKGE